MDQLTTLDAGFLEAEDSGRHVSLAIGGLAVVDGPAPDYDLLVATLGERVPSIPRFTQVLHTHLFDLGAPEWVDDARFVIAHHVHRRMCIEGRFRSRAMTPRCSDWSPKSWNGASIEIDRCGNAGS